METICWKYLNTLSFSSSCMAKQQEKTQQKQAKPEGKPASSEKTKDNTIGITIKKADDMPEWYAQVVLKSELAEYAPVKGCMIIRPLGYAVWENIQSFFNSRMKALGVKNAYFPLFIPEQFFK